jgi:hypothetical protein
MRAVLHLALNDGMLLRHIQDGKWFVSNRGRGTGRGP